eukprot:5879801-Pleurochrysis_carterae.AAC.1
MFYVVPVATKVKTMIYMGLRAILGCSAASSRLYNSWRVSGLVARQQGTAQKVLRFLFSQVYDAPAAATPEMSLECIVKPCCNLKEAQKGQ